MVSVECQTYTLSEVATMLGISRSTVYQMAGEGRLPFPVLKLSHRYVVSRAQLDRYLNGEAVSA